MTQNEREVVRWLLDQIEGLASGDTPHLALYVSDLRRLLNGTHGAASHAPRKRGRPTKVAEEVAG